MSQGVFRLPEEVSAGIDTLALRSAKISNMAKFFGWVASGVLIGAVVLGAFAFFTTPDLQHLVLSEVDIPAALSDIQISSGKSGLFGGASTLVGSLVSLWPLAVLTSILLGGALVFGVIDTSPPVTFLLATSFLLGALGLSRIVAPDVFAGVDGDGSRSLQSEIAGYAKTGNAEDARQLVISVSKDVDLAAYVALQVRLIDIGRTRLDKEDRKLTPLEKTRLNQDLTTVARHAEDTKSQFEVSDKVAFIAERTLLGTPKTPLAQGFEARVKERKVRLGRYAVFLAGISAWQFVAFGVLAIFGAQLKRRVNRIKSLLSSVMILGETDPFAMKED